MWDTKRQIAWLAIGITVGTYVVYREAFDDGGRFDPAYFAMLEVMLLIIIAIMFYIYSRSDQ